MFSDVEKAKALCLHMGANMCGGITCEDASLTYCTLREAIAEIHDSPGHDDMKRSVGEDGMVVEEQ